MLKLFIYILLFCVIQITPAKAKNITYLSNGVCNSDSCVYDWDSENNKIVSIDVDGDGIKEDVRLIQAIQLKRDFQCVYL